MYEFSIVSLSLFTPDGSLYYPKDKATFAAELQNLKATKENQSVEEEFSSNASKIIAIDGIAIVNTINIANSQINNCDDIAKCFTDMIANETEDCDKFPSEFDRYDPQSLKNNLRSNRTKVFSAVHYKVSDNTRIMHLLTKQFLSSIVTYNKRICHCIWKLSTNKCRKSRQLDNYNQEKADTGIVCHAIDVTKREIHSAN